MCVCVAFFFLHFFRSLFNLGCCGPFRRLKFALQLFLTLLLTGAVHEPVVQLRATNFRIPCLRVQFPTRETTRTLSSVEVDARTRYLSGKNETNIDYLGLDNFAASHPSVDSPHLSFRVAGKHDAKHGNAGTVH